jgi:hypothetical protein
MLSFIEIELNGALIAVLRCPWILPFNSYICQANPEYSPLHTSRTDQILLQEGNNRARQREHQRPFKYRFFSLFTISKNEEHFWIFQTIMVSCIESSQKGQRCLRCRPRRQSSHVLHQAKTSVCVGGWVSQSSETHSSSDLLHSLRIQIMRRLYMEYHVEQTNQGRRSKKR